MSTTAAATTGSPFHHERTLHEALDAYAQTVAFVSRSTQRARLSRVGVLKQRHDDIPLKSLTFDVALGMIEEWRLRPLTRKGLPCSQSFARQMIWEIRRFFKWLDQNDEFEWSVFTAIKDDPRSGAE